MSQPFEMPNSVLSHIREKVTAGAGAPEAQTSSRSITADAEPGCARSAQLYDSLGRATRPSYRTRTGYLRHLMDQYQYRHGSSARVPE
jgi:hypothetical protein